MTACGHREPVVARGWSGDAISGGLTVFDGAGVYAMLSGQCARPVPKTDGFWRPDASCIEDLDGALGPALSGVPKGRRPPDDQIYDRQIGAFTLRGERYVYLNGYPSRSHSFAWDVCNGGSSYFGLVYSVAQARFIRFDTNGSSRGDPLPTIPIDVPFETRCSGRDGATWAELCAVLRRNPDAGHDSLERLCRGYHALTRRD